MVYHVYMYVSIIGFRLHYCNSLLVGISEQNLDSIQRVQSKAARIVCNTIAIVGLNGTAKKTLTTGSQMFQ